MRNFLSKKKEEGNQDAEPEIEVKYKNLEAYDEHYETFRKSIEANRVYSRRIDENSQNSQKVMKESTKHSLALTAVARPGYQWH